MSQILEASCTRLWTYQGRNALSFAVQGLPTQKEFKHVHQELQIGSLEAWHSFVWCVLEKAEYEVFSRACTLSFHKDPPHYVAFLIYITNLDSWEHLSLQHCPVW